MAWFGPLLPGSAQQQAGGESAPTPVLSMRAAVSATISAAWSVVTVTPLFASVVLAHTNDPPVAHPSRQLEPASVVRALHPEPVWEAQTTRKLVQPFVAPSSDNPPFSSRPNYAGEWPSLVWETQHRPPLVPGSEVNNPLPFHHRYTGEWSWLSWDAQTRVKLVQPFVQLVDDPPFTIRNRYAQLVGAQWEPRALTPISVARLAQSVDNPPFSSRHNYAGEWSALTWDTQSRPHVIQGQVTVPVDNPPGHVEKYRGEWSAISWDSQTRPNLVPIADAVVNNPPFTMRNRYAQSVGSQWETRILTPITVARLVRSVDNPPTRSSLYRGEWPTATWETQTRPHVVQAQIVQIDNPPFGARHFSGVFDSVTWPHQSRDAVAHIAAVSSASLGRTLFTHTFGCIFGRVN